MSIPDHDTCYAAIQRRDARFDGRFFTGVKTTGIFCRPSCPARTPKSGNITFYPHAASALAAGFRPCRRCRPELAPGHHEWDRSTELTSRTLKAIEAGVADRNGVAGLAHFLGVSERHLRRELQATIGTTPNQLTKVRRLSIARILLDQTSLPVSDIAWASGFGSVRQFNDSIRSTFGATPSQLRRQPSTPPQSRPITLSLRSRGELGWDHLFRFLSSRAIAGLEEAIESDQSDEPPVFRRNTAGGYIDLTGYDSTLSVRCHIDDLSSVANILPRVRAVTDLDTDLEPIADHLGGDQALAVTLKQLGPLRVPGAFDLFEVGVRAIVGQQVSVPGARTLLGNLLDATCRRVGNDDTDQQARPRFDRFCSPEELAVADLTSLGMPQARKQTIVRLAQAVVDNSVQFSPHSDPDQLRKSLLSIKGIGPWTAGYITMRAIKDPDSWPVGDLVLCRALGLDTKELAQRAATWSPWRAYGAMLAWNTTCVSPQRST